MENSSRLEKAVSRIFSGEKFSLLKTNYVRNIKYVHETIGYGLTGKDKVILVHFQYLKDKNYFHVQYMLNGVTYNGKDSLGNLKMSLEDYNNLFNGVSMLQFLGFNTVSVELYKKYKKVNWKVFSVEL